MILFLRKSIHRFFKNLSPLFPDYSLKEAYLPSKDTHSSGRFIYFNYWFIRMRWIACGVAGLLSVISVKGFGYLEEKAFIPLIMVIIFLGISNLLYLLFLKKGLFVKKLIEIQMVTDLVFLTAMLHCSGGIENPLVFAYLFHIIISGILLTRRKCYYITGVASIFLSLMAFLEMKGILNHYTLYLFPHVEKHEQLLHAAAVPSYIVSLVPLQIFILFISAYFTTTIMERLRLEEKRTLAQSQRLQRVVEATGVGLAILDDNLMLLWINKRLKQWIDSCRQSHKERDHVLEKWLKKEEAVKTLQDAVIRTVEHEVKNDKGDRNFYQITISPLKNTEGIVYQIVELVQDITEQKRVQNEMIQSAKLALLGSFSSGIAHEVGNPLSSIYARLSLLKEKYPEKGFLKQSLKILQSQVSRINRIVHNISGVAKPTKQKLQMCDINQIIYETLEVLNIHPKAKNCRIDINLMQKLPKILAVKDQLVQVFLNLGLNACESMSDGGDLIIRSVKDRNGILVEFEDTGGGMDLDFESKIFDPFVSTKENGLGLGLYTVKNILQEHGGYLKIKSKTGQGSTFTVILPINNQLSGQKVG